MSVPLSIYIHIPFCEVKCGYCDFFSVPRGWKEFDLQAEYVDALCREIKERCSALTNTNIQSIFFGGGTPSLLSPDLLEKILSTLKQHFTWDNTCEITMETNPKTIDLIGLKDRKSLGINRISMGAQSFNDDFLKALGRIHSSQEAIKTIEAAIQAGFENISFDLIFALPGQSLDDWKNDLSTALDLGTSHLSCYNLSIEPGTAFAQIYGNAAVGARHAVPLPDENTALEMFWYTRNQLEQAGLTPYEISNFARPDFECRHNQNYWNYGEYLGFGVAAASFVRTKNDHVIARKEVAKQSPEEKLLPGDRHVAPQAPRDDSHFAQRRMNPRNLQKYLQNDFVPELDPLSTDIAMGEFVMLSLRTREGLSETAFAQEFGTDFQQVYATQIKQLHGNKLISQTESEYWQLSDKGLALADSVMAEFLAD